MGSQNVTPRGYTLVICEKHDAAKRIAEAISSGAPASIRVGGVTAFRLRDSLGDEFVVCAAMGHLYGLGDTVKNRRVYPVADLEWFPLDAVVKGSRQASHRISAIRSLSKGAGAFVNACDLDTEGETIGYNILRYACGGKEGSASRAKFSSLVRDEIVGAFRKDRLGQVPGLAIAGRTRHVVDFLWGVNLSRALTESLRPSGSRFRVVSIGRVQGPTLGFVVEREEEVRAFVPTPYWTARGRFGSGGSVFEADYSGPDILRKKDAEDVQASCEGHKGAVARMKRSAFSRPPPPPMNLSDLQREAYRTFGFTPSRTLQAAQRLYLGAVISYPRTSSQRLPRLDFHGLLSRIASIPGYARLVEEVKAAGRAHPVEGRESDPAHPAIYPTGEAPRRSLGHDEKMIFDLVVRRFLACFGRESVHETTSLLVSVGEHEFAAGSTRLVVPGWTSVAWGSREVTGQALPDLHEGDPVEVERVSIEEHQRARPVRYSQASLLEKMEQEGLGTKATRAGIISTLLARGYVTGESLIPTDLGFALIEAMRSYCPQIISTELTREVETGLDTIQTSPESAPEFYEEILASMLNRLGEVRSHSGDVAMRMAAGAAPWGRTFRTQRTVLGKCPVCKEGELWVIRSQKSGKRFVGCSNYPKGCRASAPLPQKGGLTKTSKPCPSCRWPVVYASFGGRRGWRLCVNPKCPRKVNVYSMQRPTRKPP
jgi:DNA topoisomerase-1